MTAKEIQDKLKELGITPGTWGETKEKIAPGLLAGQTEILTKLRDTLEKMVGQDQQKVAQLQEQIVRLKHGGGV